MFVFLFSFFFLSAVLFSVKGFVLFFVKIILFKDQVFVINSPGKKAKYNVNPFLSMLDNDSPNEKAKCNVNLYLSFIPTRHKCHVVGPGDPELDYVARSPVWLSTHTRSELMHNMTAD